jgi:hypothetical protein
MLETFKKPEEGPKLIKNYLEGVIVLKKEYFKEMGEEERFYYNELTDYKPFTGLED